MGRHLVLVLTVALVAVACTRETTQTTSPPTTSPPTSGQAPTTTDSVDGVVETPPGRLAIIDSSANVVLVDPDGSDREQLSFGEGNTAYGQPTWSPGGQRLAWSELSADSFAVGIGDIETGEVTTFPMSNLPFFMSWAPGGERVGVLHNGSVGIDFEMIDVEAGTASLLDSGSPFYFSWSPRGDRVVIHEGADRFETIDMGGEKADAGTTAPGYLAPFWTGAGILHVSDDSLVLDDNDSRRSAVAEVSEFTSFVANPQGTRVAVQSSGNGEGISIALRETAAVPLHVVSVVDVGTGEVEVVTATPSIGFFWSPDGEALLMFVPDLRRRVLEVKVWHSDGTTADYGDIVPSPLLIRDLFPFFPQYAQSMTFWAPDSSAFAIAGTSSGQSGIWVQSLAAQEPELVSDGVWVAWSRQ